jgi:peptidoglycan/LPS O-acetylase OafA/YrhL
VFYNDYFINDYFSYYAVNLFFLLSGYVNSYSGFRKRKGFLKRRFMRLYKQYYIVCVLSIIIAVYYDVFVFNDLFILVFGQFIVGNIESNVSLWSLSFEMIMYFLFYLFLSRRYVLFSVFLIIYLLYCLLWMRGFELIILFVVGILLEKANFKISSFKKEIKWAKYTYEIYIYHFLILFVISKIVIV